MKLPQSFTTVTPLSKAIAMFLFVLLPFIGFFSGIRYEKMKNKTLPPSQILPTQSPIPDDQIACTMDAKECPDGSFVGRVPPDCEFAPCLQSNSTTDWKTHQSQQFNISFKYPPTWTVDEDPIPKVGIGGIIVLTGINQHEEFTIEIGKHLSQKLLPNETLKDFDIRTRSTLVPAEVISQEVLNLNNLHVLRQVIPRKYGDNPKKFIISYIFNNNDDVYFFAAYVDDYQKQLNLLNQILSTFRFLDDNELTANWKIYTDFKNGFSIKYPPNWNVEENNQSIIKIPHAFFYRMREEFNSGINIFVVARTTPKEWIDSYYMKGDLEKFGKVTPFTADGMTGTHISNIPDYLDDYQELAFFDIAEKSIILNVDGADQEHEVFNIMLKSLIFQ